MRNFIIHNMEGTILRTGLCQDVDFKTQAHANEFVMEGKANAATQKIKFDGLDVDGQPINPRVVDKTPREIEAEKPPEPEPIPVEKQSANVTNKQWQDVLKRLDKLEKNNERPNS